MDNVIFIAKDTAPIKTPSLTFSFTENNGSTNSWKRNTASVTKNETALSNGDSSNAMNAVTMQRAKGRPISDSTDASPKILCNT